MLLRTWIVMDSTKEEDSDGWLRWQPAGVSSTAEVLQVLNEVGC